MNKNYTVNRQKTLVKNRKINSIPGISEAFTTRRIKNKNSVKKALKIKKLHNLKQVHGNRVVAAGKRFKTGVKADAIITSETNTPIAVKVADCVAMIIVDPRNKAVAAVHAGWRGTAKRIIVKAIKAMKKKFKSRPSEMIVSLSPAIRSCCYETGKDIYNKLKKDGDFSNIFTIRGGRVYMDLHKANKNLLLRAGLRNKNIYVNDICTFCNRKLYHSYRRDGKKAGRMYSIVQIEN